MYQFRCIVDKESSKMVKFNITKALDTQRKNDDSLSRYRMSGDVISGDAEMHRLSETQLAGLLLTIAKLYPQSKIHNKLLAGTNLYEYKILDEYNAIVFIASQYPKG